MTRSLIRFISIVGLCCVLSSAAMAAGVFDITVIPSIGPSGLAASYDTYGSNAAYAIENALSSYGTSGPSYYYAGAGADTVVTVAWGPVIETIPPLNSWMGSTALASGDYANEYGNDWYFGLEITSPSSAQFSLDELYFTYTVVGLPGYNGTWSYSYAGQQFSDRLVGIAKDGTRYDGSNPGTDTTLITTLYTSGSSVYIQENDPTALPGDIAFLESGSITAEYDVIPEPSTFPLLLIGFGAFVFGRKLLAGRLG